MGHDLYYVGGRPKGGIAETFFRLFEEFPKSQEFFAKSVTFQVFGQDLVTNAIPPILVQIPRRSHRRPEGGREALLRVTGARPASDASCREGHRSPRQPGKGKGNLMSDMGNPKPDPGERIRTYAYGLSVYTQTATRPFFFILDFHDVLQLIEKPRNSPSPQNHPIGGAQVNLPFPIPVPLLRALR